MYIKIIIPICFVVSLAGCFSVEKGCDDNADCRNGRECVLGTCTDKVNMTGQTDMSGQADQSIGQKSSCYCPETKDCTACKCAEDCVDGLLCSANETFSYCAPKTSCVYINHNEKDCKVFWDCEGENITFSCVGSECRCEYENGFANFNVDREDRCTNLAFIENVVNLECGLKIQTQDRN